MKAPISKEQEYLVHDYIIHTYLLDILENDLITINNANFKLKQPYIKLVETVLKKIRIELRDMKAIMNRLEIKITEPILDNVEFWQYDYYVRGYHAFSRYWDSALKMHGEKLLTHYFFNERECNINCVSKECVRFLTHTVFYLIE